VLHQLFVPYLVTALLMIAFVRARGALQRLRAYLLSP
jgi:spore maturation protein SpmB